MPVLKHIAYFQNRRDEVPNQQLAQTLVEKKNKKGIREIADHLWDENLDYNHPNAEETIGLSAGPEADDLIRVESRQDSF